MYTYEGGGSKRGYNYTAWDDINDHHTTKTNRKVETDFDF